MRCKESNENANVMQKMKFSMITIHYFVINNFFNIILKQQRLLLILQAIQ